MAFWNRKKKISKLDDEICMEEMNEQLFRDLMQDVAIEMVETRVIKEPALKFFYNDHHILQGMVLLHTTHPQYVAIRKDNLFNYLFVCGMHALGAGIYVSILQPKLGKTIEDFGIPELERIARDFEMTDSYELGLAQLGISLDSPKKKVFDQIIMTGVFKLLHMGDKEAIAQGNIWAMMLVLYNAGITIAYRK